MYLHNCCVLNKILLPVRCGPQAASAGFLWLRCGRWMREADFSTGKMGLEMMVMFQVSGEFLG